MVTLFSLKHTKMLFKKQIFTAVCVSECKYLKIFMNFTTINDKS